MPQVCRQASYGAEHAGAGPPYILKLRPDYAAPEGSFIGGKSNVVFR